MLDCNITRARGNMLCSFQKHSIVSLANDEKFAYLAAWAGSNDETGIWNNFCFDHLKIRRCDWTALLLLCECCTSIITV